jgi:hypothetical protein
MSHQYEEHAYDIFGNRYPFILHLSPITGCDLGEASIDPYIRLSGGCFSDQEFIVWVNVFVFAAMLLPMLLERNQANIASIAAIPLMTLNAVVMHVLPAVITRKYNPGLVQSIVFNAPVGISILIWAWNSMLIDTRAFVLAFICGGFFGGPLVFGPAVVMNSINIQALHYGVKS